MFQIVAIPFDAYADLPSPQHRWLLTCLARYADRDGRCWPSMRRLASDARLSLSTVCRRLSDLDRLGCFTRERKPGKRYVYQIAEAYRPRWPGRLKPAVSAGVSAEKPAVPAEKQTVSRAETQQAKPRKYIEKTYDFDPVRSQWTARLTSWQKTSGTFWLPQWGPTPTDPGGYAPRELLATVFSAPLLLATAP